MKVIPYEAKHLFAFNLQEGQKDTLCMLSPQYAQFLEGQFAFTALDEEGKIVAVGGLAEMWEGRALAWMLIDRDAGKHFVALHKVVKHMLAIAPYRRIEANAAVEFPEAHRWLRMLGFEVEAPLLRAFRGDGGDSSMYALVRKEVR